MATRDGLADAMLAPKTAIPVPVVDGRSMATAFAGYVVARNDGRTTLLLDERPVLGVGHEQMFASDPDGNASNASAMPTTAIDGGRLPSVAPP
jgi:hypothetical protein